MPAAPQNGIYFGLGGQLRSGFGKQTLARDSSNPAFGFGSGTRDAGLRLYASADHDKAQVKSSGGNQSQGAIYKISSGLGKQVLSEKASAPSYGVGTEQRKGLATKSIVPGPGKYQAVPGLGPQVDSLKSSSGSPVFGSGTRDQREKVYQDAESEKTYFGRLSPGPCMYDSQSGMGKQIVSGKHTAAATSLGYGDRSTDQAVRLAKDLPGAGDYESTTACGKQVTSRKKSLPLYSFGTSNRDKAKRVYISREHEKGQKGFDSPGPLTAKQWSASGKQVLSKKKTNPRASFGTAERFGKNYYSTASSPGPAAYAA